MVHQPDHNVCDHLWCCVLSHRYFCTTKTQLREIIGFLIPLAKMLVLMKGTEPQDSFTKYSKLTEILTLPLPNSTAII